MNNNFDQTIDRRNTGSVKWDFMAQKLGLEHDDLLPVWVSDYDFKAPQAVIDALHQRVDHGVFGYSERDQDYFEAVTRWYQQRHGVAMDKEWIATIDGVLPGIAMLLQLITESGDEIVMQSPGYGSFNKIIELNQRRVVENPLIEEQGHYSMDLAHLERCFEAGAKVMLLCNPHNPVGRAWREDELEALAALCQRHQVWLISDEIWADLAMPGHEYHSALKLRPILGDRLIVATAASKTFGLASLRMANFVLPDAELKARFVQRMDAHGMDVYNCLSMTAATTAYNQCGQWLDSLKIYLQGNIDALTDHLATHLPGVSFVPPEAGYLVWLDCRALGMSDKELEERCHAQGLVPSMGVGFGRAGSGFIRLNLGCPRALLDDACMRLTAALK